MDEPAEWRSLAERFSKLGQGNNDERMYAIWVSSHPWELAGGEDEHAREAFRLGAERAAVLAGQRPGPESLQWWLDFLREHSSHYGEISGDSPDDKIDDVCAGSVECCYKRETIAFDKMRIELISSFARARNEAQAYREFQVEEKKKELRLKDPQTNISNIDDTVDEPSPERQGPTHEPAKAETATHQQVDHFIERVLSTKARHITRSDIWRVAGYTEATQFERFQREKNTSAGSVIKFGKILKLGPAEFLQRLDDLNSQE
jgi:hypothetical protein